MRIVFVSKRFQWPLRTGSSVHAGNLMKSMVRLGEKVSFLTQEAVVDDARDWLSGVHCENISVCSEGTTSVRPSESSGFLDRKLAGFFGWDEMLINEFHERIASLEADAVVGVGYDTIPVIAYRAPRSQFRSCWYLADDPLLQNFELYGLRRMRGLIKTMLITRVVGSRAGGVWVVSQKDARWSGVFSGLRNVTVVPNGVDASVFRLGDQQAVRSEGCCFWGNLGFPPNESAIRYFLRNIWPTIIEAIPTALFHVAGVRASESLVTELEQAKGCVFYGEVPDVREAFSHVNIAVFPFVDGAGVKNKVLEAAAMGMAIMVSKKASNGLVGPWREALLMPRSRDEWVLGLVGLMQSPGLQKQLCDRAHDWVTTWHTWDKSAAIAIASINKMPLPLK
jgi:glycosyltransferase involved in cell wall biosynthesis